MPDVGQEMSILVQDLNDYKHLPRAERITLIAAQLEIMGQSLAAEIDKAIVADFILLSNRLLRKVDQEEIKFRIEPNM